MNDPTSVHGAIQLAHLASGQFFASRIDVRYRKGELETRSRNCSRNNSKCDEIAG